MRKKKKEKKIFYKIEKEQNKKRKLEGIRFVYIYIGDREFMINMGNIFLFYFI